MRVSFYDHKDLRKLKTVFMAAPGVGDAVVFDQEAYVVMQRAWVIYVDGEATVDITVKQVRGPTVKKAKERKRT